MHQSNAIHEPETAQDKEGRDSADVSSSSVARSSHTHGEDEEKRRHLIREGEKESAFTLWQRNTVDALLDQLKALVAICRAFFEILDIRRKSARVVERLYRLALDVSTLKGEGRTREGDISQLSITMSSSR
jgi:hypothetical protein